MTNPTQSQIREVDEYLESMLQDTKSPKIASLVKNIQLLKEGKSRWAAFQLIKHILPNQ